VNLERFRLRVARALLAVSLSLVGDVAIAGPPPERGFEVKKGQRSEAHAKNREARLKRFAWDKDAGELVIGDQVVPIVFTKNGAVTISGVEVKTVDEAIDRLLALGEVSADEVVALEALLASGELSVGTPARTKLVERALNRWAHRLDVEQRRKRAKERPGRANEGEAPMKDQDDKRGGR
jgi:hypothetical protein